MDFMNDRADERPVATAHPADAQSRPDITGAYQRGDMLALEMGLRGPRGSRQPVWHNSDRISRSSSRGIPADISESGNGRSTKAPTRYGISLQIAPTAVRSCAPSYPSDRSYRRKSGMPCFARTPLMFRSDIA